MGNIARGNNFQVNSVLLHVDCLPNVPCDFERICRIKVQSSHV